MRKPILLLALLMSLLMVLSACVPPAAVEEAPAADESAAETASEDGESGECIISIGAAVSETGKYAREGKDVRQGYDLWADWVNGEGGGIAMGDQVCQAEIVYYDDESDPDTVSRLVEKLVTEDEVDILLGPYSSSMTMAASAIAEKYDVIMVEGNGSSETLFERGFKNLFAVLTPAGNYGESALKSLSELGAESVVIAYEDTAFPTSVATGAIAWAEEYGLEVLAVETYPKDVPDVSGIIAKFKELEPDVFLGGGHFNDALLFVRAAKELDFNPKAMVITVGPSNPSFVEEVGADAEYIIGPTQWERTMAYADEYFGTAEEYAQRYEGMWDESPTYQAAESTATALALQLAIEAAGTTETAAVRDALNALDEVLFYGPVKFDETGKNAGKPMGAIQIQDGNIVVVAPEDSAVAEIRYPMPAWNER